jgi:hypothetical protein
LRLFLLDILSNLFPSDGQGIQMNETPRLNSFIKTGILRPGGADRGDEVRRVTCCRGGSLLADLVEGLKEI